MGNVLVPALTVPDDQFYPPKVSEASGLLDAATESCSGALFKYGKVTRMKSDYGCISRSCILVGCPCCQRPNQRLFLQLLNTTVDYSIEMPNYAVARHTQATVDPPVAPAVVYGGGASAPGVVVYAAGGYVGPSPGW